MFKPLRTVAAVAAVAGVAAVGGAAPSSADAAVAPSAHAAARCYYEIPSSFVIKHSNGWTVATRSKAGRVKWNISAWYGSRQSTLFGTMRLTRFDVAPGRNGERPIVEFTVTLSNGSAGVYTGTISRRGFIIGNTADEFHPDSTARFWVLDPVDCV
jgi:hypothetical protein